MADIDLFVFHQASKVALDGIQSALEIPDDKMLRDIAEIGNLIGASIPVALGRAMQSGRAKRGQKLLVSGFGSGLSWGTAVLDLSATSTSSLNASTSEAPRRPSSGVRSVCGEWIANQVKADIAWLTDKGVGPGTVVVLLADYSPRSTSLLLALAAQNAIFVPLLPATLAKNPEIANIVEADVQIRVDDGVALERQPGPAADRHPLVRRLQDQGGYGSGSVHSGSTGAPERGPPRLRALVDQVPQASPNPAHFEFSPVRSRGGLNTLFTVWRMEAPLSFPKTGTPTTSAHCSRIKVELLPASPRS